MWEFGFALMKCDKKWRKNKKYFCDSFFAEEDLTLKAKYSFKPMNRSSRKKCLHSSIYFYTLLYVVVF